MFSRLIRSYNQSSQSKSMARPVLGETEEINLMSLKTLKEPIKLVSKFISAYNPDVIPTPFKGTDLKVAKDGNTILFASSNGRMAKLNLSKQNIELDTKIDETAIWTLDLSQNEDFIYVSGINPVIRKYNIKTFELVGKLKGHSGEVFQIIVTPDGNSMVSCSMDTTVKLWSLIDKSPPLDIFKHKGPVQTIDLAIDGNFIMTGSLDKTSSILKLDQGKWSLSYTITEETSIYAVKISPQISYAITGCEDGTLRAYKFGTWDLLKQFKDTDKIWVIDVPSNEEFIVTGGMSKNVVIWDMVKERERIELKGHTLWIKSTVVSNDQQSIISLSNDSKIMKWKIPKFEERTVIHTESKVLELWFSNVNGLLYAHLQTSEGNNIIDAWNLVNTSKVKTIEITDTGLTDWQKSEDDTLFYIMYKIDSVYYITSYDLVTGIRNQEQLLGAIEVSCFKVSKDHTYLFIGQTYKIRTLYLQKNLEVYNFQIYHSGKVEYIVSTSNNKYIISADNLSYLILIDVELMANVDVRNDLATIIDFNEKNATVLGLRMIDDDTLIAVSDKMVMFWSIDKKAVIKMLEKTDCIHVDSSLDCKYTFLRTNNKLEIWTVENFSYNCFIQYESQIDSFHISPDNKTLAYSTEDKIMISRSPLSTKTIYICGDVAKKYEFLNFMNSIINSTSENFVQGFDDWIIEPFHLNSLHFYAYYNWDEYLTKAIQLGAPFFCTAHGYSPLAIALELNYPVCVSAILKEVRVIFEQNPFIYLTIERSLPALNASRYDRLHALYDSMFSKSCNANLPKFCDNKPRLPIVSVSDSFLPKKESFEPAVNFSEDGIQIHFIQSYVKIPLLAGTTESIEFLESIKDCRNLRIFDTQFVQILLQEKWAQVRWVSYTQALVYMIFLIILSLYTVEYRNSTFLIVPFAFNCLFFCYETSYIFASHGSYFQDYWNYLDLSRIIGVAVYSILIWTNVYPDENWFLAVIILVSWVRGVMFFRVFKATRYLINLLIKSCIDIAGFLLILFYSTVSFAIIFYALVAFTDENNNTLDFFHYATKIYEVNLGSGDTSTFDKLDWLFFVPLTILNHIIMVNLLISILGDTYSNVKEYESVNDAREMIAQITEAEFIMFWRRTMSDRKYMHMCEEVSPVITGPQDSMKKKIRFLKGKVLKMKKDMDKEEAAIGEIINALKKRNADVLEVIEKYENKKT